MFSSAIERLNQRRSGAGESGVDAGFTLIELMVVLLILAILLAIAIPTFLGVTGGANDRAAQSNLNTALTTVKAAATNNNQAYTGNSNPVNQTLLTGNEPSIKWIDNSVAGSTPGATNQGNVSWYVDAGGQGIVLASPSKNNNTCWYAVDNLQTLSAAAGNGAYGDTAGTVTSHNEAPAQAGTFYSQGKQINGGCNAGSAITTTKDWSGSF